MAILEANTDLDVKGRLLATDVPNSTGSIVTWNANTNVFGLRTDAQILSDLGLNTVISNSHTHSNKTVLDGITSTNVSNWNTAFGWGDFRDYGLGAGQSTIGTWDLSQNYSGFVSASDHGGVLGQSSGRLWGFRTSYSSTSYGVELAMRNSRAAFQTRDGGVDSGWLELYHSGNLRSNAENDARYLQSSDISGLVPYTGATANVNLGTRSITSTGGFIGNATTATTLATSRTINGTSFNGSANITTARWGTARNITIGDTTKSVNGSGNVSWSLAEIGINTGDFVPYTGANQSVDLNTQDLSLNGNLIKQNSTLEQNIFGTGNSSSNHLRRYYNAASFLGVNSAPGVVVVTIPITSSTMWNAQISIQEYVSSAAYSSTRRTTLIVGAYTTTNTARFVSVDNADRIAKVAFGKDSSNRTVVLIHMSSSSMPYPKIIIDWVQAAHNYSSGLEDKTLYDISTIAAADIPTLGLTINGEITNANFQRDSYYLDYNNFTNKPTIPNSANNGLLTISTSSDLTGGGTFSADQATASNVAIGLSASTLSNIQLGVTAHDWGNHEGKYLSLGESTNTNGQFQDIDFDNLLLGNYVMSISHTSLNSPITTPRSLLRMRGSHNNSVSDLLIGSNRVAFRNSQGGVWYEFWHTGNFNPAQYVPTARTITAGNGLSGGGNLTANRTITLGTPSAIGISTTNSVTSTSHTHALDSATTTAINQGVTAHSWGNHASQGYLTSNQTITLSGDVSGSGTTSITVTISSNAVEAGMLNNNIISGKTALTSGLVSTDELMISDGGVIKRMDVSVLQTYMQSNLAFSNNSGTVTSVSGGNGLTGTVTSSGSISMGTPSAITLSSTNNTTSSSHTHAFTPGGTVNQFIDGTGSLQNISTLTPTLDEVLTAGNTSSSTIAIPQLELTGTTGSIEFANSGIIYSLNSQVTIIGGYSTNQTDGVLLKSGNDNVRFHVSDTNKIYFKTESGTIFAKLQTSSLTANRSYQMPDESGTLALQSDIEGKIDSITLNGVLNNGNISSKPILLGEGSTSMPSYSFSSDDSTGLILSDIMGSSDLQVITESSLAFSFNDLIGNTSHLNLIAEENLITQGNPITETLYLNTDGNITVDASAIGKVHWYADFTANRTLTINNLVEGASILVMVINNNATQRSFTVNCSSTTSNHSTANDITNDVLRTFGIITIPPLQMTLPGAAMFMVTKIGSTFVTTKISN